MLLSLLEAAAAESMFLQSSSSLAASKGRAVLRMEWLRRLVEEERFSLEEMKCFCSVGEAFAELLHILTTQGESLSLCTLLED